MNSDSADDFIFEIYNQLGHLKWTATITYRNTEITTHGHATEEDAREELLKNLPAHWTKARETIRGNQWKWNENDREWSRIIDDYNFSITQYYAVSCEWTGSVESNSSEESHMNDFAMTRVCSTQREALDRLIEICRNWVPAKVLETLVNDSSSIR